MKNNPKAFYLAKNFPITFQSVDGSNILQSSQPIELGLISFIVTRYRKGKYSKWMYTITAITVQTESNGKGIPQV